MPRYRARQLLLLALAAGVGAGCGGGGGGGDVTLATDDQGEDPVVLEIPIAYIRRPIPEIPPDLRDPLAFQPGARLYVREQSATTAEEVDVTDQIAAIVAEEEGVSADQVAIDIQGLESAYDGSTLLFSARAVPEPVPDNLANTTWNLWTFDLESMQAAYLIPSRIKRNEGVAGGGGHDIAPHYLPDDRIVFSSTRQVAGQARLLNEGRNQLFAALDEDGGGPAAVLHIYDPLNRRAEFEQISFNLSHDLDPTVLADGQLLFSRWNNTTGDHISLYRVEPSGLGLSPLYGYHSQATGTEGARVVYSAPRELDDGKLVSVVRQVDSVTLGGALSVIDANNFSDRERPVPGGASGQAQSPLTRTEVRNDGQLSPGGQFGSVYPLRDGSGRLLVTWSECRVVDDALAPGAEPSPGDYLPCTLQPENGTPAPPLYGAWVYDTSADTQRPLVLAREGFVVSEVIAAEPRAYPAVLARGAGFNTALEQERRGQLVIDSVYDVDGSDASPAGISRHAVPGTAAYRERPARFLRLVQPVPLPDPSIYRVPRFAFGPNPGLGFREIIGYVPIEPDGSVTASIPADRPFNFSLLDSAGRRIGSRHDYWLQLRAGEVLRCGGCHGSDSDVAHGRPDARPESANPGSVDLPEGSSGFPGTDTDRLFATEPGQTMAQVWDFHQPADNPVAVARTPSLWPRYRDQWAAPGNTPDADILDRDYDPAWAGLPTASPLVTASLDPREPDRIVINYPDHIQPIWERPRETRQDSQGTPVDTCLACHDSAGGTRVPAGQLDLAASVAESGRYQSFSELLIGGSEQWLDDDGVLADRIRLCTVENDAGDTVEVEQTFSVAPAMRAGSANASTRFFACFEGGNCGRPASPPLPDNCSELGGTPAPATTNTVAHAGLLSASELHLLSEWLDIGAQYFNNPFDARLAE